MLLPRTDSHDPDANDADPRSTSSAPSVSAPALSFTTTADALASTPLSNTNPCAAYNWFPDTRSTAPPDATTRALAYNAYSPPNTAASSATPPPTSSSTVPSTTTVRPPVTTVTRATLDTTSTDRTSRRPDSTSTGAYGEDCEPGRYTSGVGLAATSRESVTVSTDPAGNVPVSTSAPFSASTSHTDSSTGPPSSLPAATRTAQRSTAHHVQHGAVQQRHVLHNDPHAVPRHPRHVKHRTHAVQHNVAQRHLARAGRHNEHRLHRHALAEEHTRRSAHSERQRGSSHRHARLAVPAAAALAHAHTVPHARRRRPGRVAVRVPVAGVAPNNVDAPSVAKTGRCVLLRRRQDTSTSVVARHPHMRPSRKRRQAQRQHPRQQHSVAHKAQRAPSSGHGASGVEHLPRDTVVHVVLH
ncbi:hypothetical protein ECC02_006683 [Trypanosoma cruzi]|uniref:Mucin-2 n=1 Tax=Trypanosoma cruzi TaxID=5693 RepID=A0A7J6Y0Q2_TRYCR|nr:hypothetical protein ECC02_006683 [Trypanosoma cruzi]